jgi:hypothetical protein
MTKVITFSKPKKFIGYAGVTEESETDPNNIRKMTVDLRQAIGVVFKPRSNKGKPLGYITEKVGDKYTTKGEDAYGIFLAWKFPVFTTNKNEMYITVKVWTDEVHGGSCIMWCETPYRFTDGQSAVQFATMLDVSIEQAIAMMKRWVRKNNS